MSESNRQHENIYTNVNDLPLLETEYISNSNYSEFECKDDPLQINFQDSNKWSKQNESVAYLNPNCDWLFDSEIESAGIKIYKISEESINPPCPINLNPELEEHYPKKVLVHSPARKTNTRKMYKSNSKKCHHCHYIGKTSYRIHVHIMF